jgi:hypothetical protein
MEFKLLIVDVYGELEMELKLIFGMTLGFQQVQPEKCIPPRGSIILDKVADLINPVTGTWDEALIRDIFWGVDATRILEIPLSPTSMEDFVAWHYTKTGLFTVWSAYHAEWDYQFGRHNPNAMGIGDSQHSKLWKRLWSMNIPAKIKIFGGRVLHGFISCLGVLANRHIAQSSQCPICNIGYEDILHTLFTCPRAKQIWEKVGIYQVSLSSLQTNMRGPILIQHKTNMRGPILIQHMIMNPSISQSLKGIGVAKIILTGAWYLWWERRQFTHGEQLQPVHRSAMSIGVLATNYWRAKKKTILSKKET